MLEAGKRVPSKRDAGGVLGRHRSELRRGRIRQPIVESMAAVIAGELHGRIDRGARQIDRGIPRAQRRDLGRKVGPLVHGEVDQAVDRAAERSGNRLAAETFDFRQRVDAHAECDRKVGLGIADAEFRVFQLEAGPRFALERQ